MGKVQTIYNHLLDDNSKFIFRNRLLYSITSDYKYIRNIVLETEIGKEVLEMLIQAEEKGKGIVLDGAGVYGEYMFQDYPNIKWSCICDSREVEKPIFGDVPVLQRKKAVEKYCNAVFVIDSIVYFDDIENELLSLGIKKDNILNIGRKIHEIEQKMYFDIPHILPKQKNLFIDCGAFRGESSKEFIHWCGEKEYEILAFEPDRENFVQYRENVKNLDKIKVFNAVAYDEKGKVYFNNTGTSSASVNGEGDDEVEALTIDEVVGNAEITYIKMDVEGSELKVLGGAQDSIKRCSPVLAISLYHKPEDIVDLLDFCLNINSNYHFILKHYTLGKAETVAFAIAEKQIEH
ncbi:MAG: FkbM family methyltransferase [Lachnospiraceae bacterium]|nr:FkbM family methyltransferase [Lachnospiraceae bacterium]